MINKTVARVLIKSDNCANKIIVYNSVYKYTVHIKEQIDLRLHFYACRFVSVLMAVCG